MESLTGPQIQALAYEQSPIEPQGLAATIQAVTIFLLVFSTIVTVVRFIIRGWKTKFELLWGVDDYLAVIALVSNSPPKQSKRSPITSYRTLTSHHRKKGSLHGR